MATTGPYPLESLWAPGGWQVIGDYPQSEAGHTPDRPATLGSVDVCRMNTV